VWRQLQHPTHTLLVVMQHPPHTPPTRCFAQGSSIRSCPTAKGPGGGGCACTGEEWASQAGVWRTHQIHVPYRGDRLSRCLRPLPGTSGRRCEEGDSRVAGGHLAGSSDHGVCGRARAFLRSCGLRLRSQVFFAVTFQALSAIRLPKQNSRGPAPRRGPRSVPPSEKGFMFLIKHIQLRQWSLPPSSSGARGVPAFPLSP
jgi:hypothetical protein